MWRSNLAMQFSPKQLIQMPVYSSCANHRLSSQSTTTLNLSAKCLTHNKCTIIVQSAHTFKHSHQSACMETNCQFFQTWQRHCRQRKEVNYMMKYSGSSICSQRNTSVLVIVVLKLVDLLNTNPPLLAKYKIVLGKWQNTETFILLDSKKFIKLTRPFKVVIRF